MDYLDRFSDDIFVIKFSGSLAYKEEILNSIVGDVLFLKERIGSDIVIVHGAQKMINEFMNKYGKKPKFKDGLRMTDEESIPLVISAFEQTNQKIVKLLNKNSEKSKAIGISGISGDLFRAKRKSKELGYVGEIERVNSEIVSVLMEKHLVPVIYTIGSNERGEQLNLNSDAGAGELAFSLNVDRYIALTGVKGILKDAEDENSLIKKLTYKEAIDLKNKDFIGGHMMQKVKSCTRALEGGANTAHIIKAKKHALLKELLTSESIGTLIESL